jgi:hypothetical protein
MVEALIVGLIITTAGALVAGYFSLRTSTRSHQLDRAAQVEQDCQTAERIRTLLSLEIDQNLLAFEKYDAGIDDRILFQNRKLQPKDRPNQLSDTPMPVWKHDYWEGLTASIPSALTTDEIKKCHEFHARLKELTRLSNISRNPNGNWHLCVEQEISALKQLGNPLVTNVLATFDTTTKAGNLQV